MNYRRFDRPPRGFRRPSVRSDNLVLVPGNVLAEIERWQALANDLPRGEVLIVLPETNTALRPLLTTVATYFEASGHPVTMLSTQTQT